MTRTLRLSRETLADLTPEDLAVVVGGAATGGCPWTFRVRECLTTSPTCWTE